MTQIDGCTFEAATPEERLARIVREIRMFNIICGTEEHTDTDAVWSMLGNIVFMATGEMTIGKAILPSGPFDLDSTVHRLKDHEAHDINQKGVRGQLQYLRERLGYEEFDKLIAEEPDLK